MSRQRRQRQWIKKRHERATAAAHDGSTPVTATELSAHSKPASGPLATTDGGKGGVTFVSESMAINQDWPVSPDIKQRVITEAARCLEHSESERIRVAAMRVLVAADANNIRRRGNKIEEERTDVLRTTAAMRMALQDPETRKAMAALSNRMCIEVKPAEPAPDRPQAARTAHAGPDRVDHQGRP